MVGRGRKGEGRTDRNAMFYRKPARQQYDFHSRKVNKCKSSQTLDIGIRIMYDVQFSRILELCAS